MLRVTALRYLIRAYPLLATVVVAAALVLRIAVPGGFMPVVADGHVTVSICTGAGPVQKVLALPKAQRGKSSEAERHDNYDKTCPFAGLSAVSLAAADASLLVAAILFAMAVAARRPAPLVTDSPARLRPPLRGPPTIV